VTASPTAFTKQYQQPKRQLGYVCQMDHPVVDWNDEDIHELQRLVLTHGVVCVKNQSNMNALQYQTFVQRLATLSGGAPIQLPEALGFNNREVGAEHIVRVGNVNHDGTIRPSWQAAEYWHQDGDFWPDGKHIVWNCLTSRIKPKVGGFTGFLDLVKGFDNLSEEAQNELENAKTVVTLSDIQDFQYVKAHPEIAAELNSQADGSNVSLNGPTCHHTLHYHPNPAISKKLCYLGSNIAKIHTNSGAQDSAGKWIDMLESALDKQKSREVSNCATDYVHQWEVGDMLIWDNISVMHRSLGGYGDNPRLLWRMQIRTKWDTDEPALQ
jgi:taurine dioxygenase